MDGIGPNKQVNRMSQPTRTITFFQPSTPPQELVHTQCKFTVAFYVSYLRTNCTNLQQKEG